MFNESVEEFAERQRADSPIERQIQDRMAEIRRRELEIKKLQEELVKPVKVTVQTTT